MTRSRRAALVVVALAAVVVGAGLGWATLGGDRYTVSFESTRHPRLAAGEAAAIVREQLEAMRDDYEAMEEPVQIDIVSIRAIDLSSIGSAMPGILDVEGDVDAESVVWVVEAMGPHVSDKGPPPGATGSPVRTSTHGWWAISDDDGSIIAFSSERD
jgi:hypothetical protein